MAPAVVGGCLLTGGYGSAIGAAFRPNIWYGINGDILYRCGTDWFKVFRSDDVNSGYI